MTLTLFISLDVVNLPSQVHEVAFLKENCK